MPGERRVVNRTASVTPNVTFLPIPFSMPGPLTVTTNSPFFPVDRQYILVGGVFALRQSGTTPTVLLVTINQGPNQAATTFQITCPAGWSFFSNMAQNIGLNQYQMVAVDVQTAGNGAIGLGGFLAVI